jgi:DNA mismatch repair protein MSH5
MLVDTTSATFQIRPSKEFNSTKGKDRLLYLNRLVDLPMDDHMSLNDKSSATSEGGGVSRNAYDFMRQRRDETGDPTMKRWNASIRLSNFASIENSPLCVRNGLSRLNHVPAH